MGVLLLQPLKYWDSQPVPLYLAKGCFLFVYMCGFFKFLKSLYEKKNLCMFNMLAPLFIILPLSLHGHRVAAGPLLALHLYQSRKKRNRAH